MNKTIPITFYSHLGDTPWHCGEIEARITISIDGDVWEVERIDVAAYRIASGRPECDWRDLPKDHMLWQPMVDYLRTEYSDRLDDALVAYERQSGRSPYADEHRLRVHEVL